MDKKFCDRCGEEVKEHSVVSILGRNYTTLTNGTVRKMMKDMELCPSCTEAIIAVCQSK